MKRYQHITNLPLQTVGFLKSIRSAETVLIGINRKLQPAERSFSENQRYITLVGPLFKITPIAFSLLSEKIVIQRMSSKRFESAYCDTIFTNIYLSPLHDKMVLCRTIC